MAWVSTAVCDAPECTGSDPGPATLQAEAGIKPEHWCGLLLPRQKEQKIFCSIGCLDTFVSALPPDRR